MVSSRLKRYAFAFLCSAAFPVFSQEPAAGTDRNISFYTKIENGETVFVQRLSWQKAEHARDYEITIERRSGSGWETALREKTRDTFIEFSFSGGDYRYQIQVYDFLNRPAGNSSWREFLILAVRRPEIDIFSPAVLEKGGNIPHLVTLTGKNFLPSTRIFLRNSKTGRQIEPVSIRVSEDREVLEIRVNPAQIPAGIYEIHAINPGGLESSAGPLNVRITLGTVGFTYQAGYAPLLPLYGTIFDVFSEFAPLGLYARTGILPLKTARLDAGFDLSLFWDYFDQNRPVYRAQAHLVESRFSALGRWAVLPRESLFVNLRLGGGLTALLGFVFSDGADTSERFNGIYFSAAGDLSLQWFPLKKPSKFAPFFVEAGLGYDHIFKEQNSSVRFFAGAGAKY